MEDIHNNYVQEFLKQGVIKMNQFGYEIEPKVIKGPDGLTSIKLRSLKTNIDYFIQFAYNRLDYNSGVIIYKGLKK